MRIAASFFRRRLLALSSILLFFCPSLANANDKAHICFSFNITLRTNGGTPPSGYDLTAGLAEVDAQGLAFLNDQITSANVDVQVLNFTSTLVGVSATCQNAVVAGLDQCALASTQICVEALSTARTQLVETLGLAKVRQWIDDFNTDYAGRIHVTYEAPLPVTTIVQVMLQGVTTPLDEEEQTRLEAAVQTELGRLLQDANANEVTFDLIRVTTVVQTPLLSQQDRRDRRGLQQPTVVANLVDLVLRAHCSEGPTACTKQAFSTTVQSEAPVVEKELLPALQTDTPSTNYFDRVSDIAVADTTTQGSGSGASSVLNINVTEILERASGSVGEARTEPQEIEEEDIPWWFYVLGAASALVIVAGSWYTFKAVQTRNREHSIREAFEAHSEKGGPRGGFLFGRRGPVGDPDDDDNQVVSPSSTQQAVRSVKEPVHAETLGTGILGDGGVDVTSVDEEEEEGNIMGDDVAHHEQAEYEAEEMEAAEREAVVEEEDYHEPGPVLSVGAETVDVVAEDDNNMLMMNMCNDPNLVANALQSTFENHAATTH